MFQLTVEEKDKVVAICDHLQNLKYSPYLPHVFSEHGIVVIALPHPFQRVDHYIYREIKEIYV